MIPPPAPPAGTRQISLPRQTDAGTTVQDGETFIAYEPHPLKSNFGLESQVPACEKLPVILPGELSLLYPTIFTLNLKVQVVFAARWIPGVNVKLTSFSVVVPPGWSDVIVT